MVAEKGYAANSLREQIGNLGLKPAIPAKSSEAPVDCPAWFYNNRHRVESAWANLKEWRAIATRYEKNAISLVGVLCLAPPDLWIET